MMHHIRQSLITRLMMYFVFAGLFLTLVFGINLAYSVRVHFKQEVLPNIAQYLEYNVQDIGTPPDINKAQQLSQKLSLMMRIQGQGIDWKSDKHIPDINTLELETAPEPFQQFRILRVAGRNYVLLENEGYQFLYVIGRPFGHVQGTARGIWSVLLLLAITGLTMLVLFLRIRSSLRPLEYMGEGINKIAQGDLENTLQTTDKSIEFRRLAEGINDMSRQIKSMLDSKHQLLLAISHELRSPITRAKVNLEFLPPSQVRQDLADDCREMEALVHQILESERLNHHHAVLNKSEFALDTLLDELVESYYATVPLNLQIPHLTLYADRTRIQLLLKNLIDNALKYSTSDNPPPVIKAHQHDKQLIIEVEDFGCGMDESELSRITQAFYRVDHARQRSTGGVGLGLYLCELIVKAHQGSMDFSSTVGSGSVVKLTLPS